MFKTKTREEFIAEARVIHGDRYGYEDFVYVQSRTRGLIKCAAHGLFGQTPDVHKQGKGCPGCAIEGWAGAIAKGVAAKRGPQTCVICGSSFLPRAHAQLCCSKPCSTKMVSERFAKKRVENIEEFRAREAKYYAENAEKVKERKAKYYAENPEKMNAAQTKYRAKNPEKVREHASKYAKENPDKRASLQVKRQAAKLRAVPSWASKEAIQVYYTRAAELTKLTGVSHEVDHIIPLQGRTVCGLHWEGNLQILTDSENARKHNRIPKEYAEWITV